MRGEPTCPRCGGRVRAPGLFSDSWQCDAHGAVPPLQPVLPPSVEALGAAVGHSRVPVWLPWPLPVGWLYTGIAHAGDEASGTRATAVACSGPGPLGGCGDLVLVAEEPGVGLGARYAGIPGPDPGRSIDVHRPADAKLLAAGHPTPMWLLPGTPEDRAVFAGEALGLWIWAVAWPESAGMLLYEELVLADLREVGAELELVPRGALSPRILS